MASVQWQIEIKVFEIIVPSSALADDGRWIVLFQCIRGVLRDYWRRRSESDENCSDDHAKILNYS